MAAWPSTLPMAVVSGYGLEPAPHTVRSEMDAGPARVRRTSMGRVDTVNASWMMSREEFSAFRAWYESDAGGGWGAAWFDIDLQAGQAVDGTTTTETARFVEQWSAALVDQHLYRVTATLELR